MKPAAAIFSTTAALALCRLCSARLVPPEKVSSGWPDRSCGSARAASLAVQAEGVPQPYWAAGMWYTPRCDADGAWSAEQALVTPVGMATWCADNETGEVVDGSVLRPDVKRRLPCGAGEGAAAPDSCGYKAAEALRRREILVREGITVDWYYTPRCDEDGSWSPEQYTYGPGGPATWCADTATGEAIPGTLTYDGPGAERTVPCCDAGEMTRAPARPLAFGR